MHSQLTANQNSQSCIIIGHSIDAITTATVMASLGHQVALYTNQVKLQHTLANYTFEYQLQALWQLYTANQQIIIQPVPSDASEFFVRQNESDNKSGFKQDVCAERQHHYSVYWLFYPELPETWRQQSDGQDDWITQLNDSQTKGHTSRQTPLIVSGIDKLGVFADIANQCLRPWVYYVPFVFLQDGRTFSSMLSPSLWLMGEKTTDSSDKVSFLHPLMAQAQQCSIADIATIEFSRSAIMNMLATRVSFMNEWSRLADYFGVDITEVSTIMGLDDRVGKSYLQAGWGFGGTALPIEISALRETVISKKLECNLMKVVNHINEDQKELIFRKFWQYFEGRIEGKTVSIWGAGYKAGSGRTSASAIHPLLHLLWSYHITTYVYAVEAKAELAGLYPNQPLLQFITDPTEQLDDSDALFVMTWSRSKKLPLAKLNEVVVPVFDASNVFSRAQIDALVGDYQGIGRGK